MYILAALCPQSRANTHKESAQCVSQIAEPMSLCNLIWALTMIVPNFASFLSSRKKEKVADKPA